MAVGPWSSRSRNLTQLDEPRGDDIADHSERATAAVLRFVGRFTPDESDDAVSSADSSGSVTARDREALAKAVHEMKSRMSLRVRESMRSAARETE